MFDKVLLLLFSYVILISTYWFIKLLSNIFVEQRKGKAGHDTNWLKTMITKGTTKDKIAAHVISIQNAPMYSLSILHGLISMVKASKKHDCASVMGK